VSERPEDGEAQDGAGAVRDVDVVQLVADELLDWLGDANRRHDQQCRYTRNHTPTTLGGVTTWRRGAVVSGIRRMNVGPGYYLDGLPSSGGYTISSQLGQLSLASLRGRLIEYQLRLGVRAGMSPLPGGR